MILFGDVDQGIDDPMLARAAHAAVAASGRTAPNPCVGAVVVDADGRVVAVAHHERAGGPHAEVLALREAGGRAAGGTLFVTLEPCSHHGRTPPCTDAILASGISRVVIGMPDPSEAAGGGATILARNGVEVGFAPDPAPFEGLNPGWLSRVRRGRPWVIAKVGVSIDGCVSLAPGARTSITGAHGALVTQRLRRRVQAVVVGGATAAVDDPSLTRRTADGRTEDEQPLRVVLAGDDPLRADLQLFADEAAPTLVIARDAGSAAGVPSTVETQVCDSLSGVLTLLASRGIDDVLFEPGPRLLESLVNEGLCDALVTVVAGGFGSRAGRALWEGPATSAGTRLEPAFLPLESGIVGDVAVTVWGAAGAGRTLTREV